MGVGQGVRVERKNIRAQAPNVMWPVRGALEFYYMKTSGRQSLLYDWLPSGSRNKRQCVRAALARFLARRPQSSAVLSLRSAQMNSSTFLQGSAGRINAHVKRLPLAAGTYARFERRFKRGRANALSAAASFSTQCRSLFKSRKRARSFAVTDAPGAFLIF